MTKKTIYINRHGETDYNKKGAVQGRGIDADLNVTGRQQAKAFYDKHKNVPFEKIYISSLKRTYQTAELFINSGIAYEAMEELDEISWGKVEGLTLHEAGINVFDETLNQWRKGNSWAALEGGESIDQVAERQKLALKKILANKDEKLILITMHGRALRILLCHLLGYPFAEMERFEHTNTGLYVLEYDYYSMKYEVKTSNDISHLSKVNS